MIDPPTVAGITIGVIAGGVALVCLIGSLINWIHQTRRNKLRRQLEDSYRWHSQQRPPDPPVASGNGISAPIPRQENRFQPHLSHEASYGGYGRSDASKIGLAVNPTGNHTDAMRSAFTQPQRPVLHIPNGTPYNPPFEMSPNKLEKEIAMFEEDDSSTPAQTHMPALQSQHHYSQPPENSALEVSASQPYKSSLRPRDTQLPTRSSSRRSPPSLDPQSLNNPGIPRIRIRPATLELPLSLRVSSNAHAQSLTIDNQSQSLVFQSRMKALPEEPKYPSYVPDYYTSDSPRTPMPPSAYSPPFDMATPVTAISLKSPFSTPTTSAEAHMSSKAVHEASAMTLSETKSSDVSTAQPATHHCIGTAEAMTTLPLTFTSSTPSSASSNTTFESLENNEITPPLEALAVDTQTLPSSKIGLRSPISGLRYPKIPRPSAQIVPRVNPITLTAKPTPTRPLPTPPMRQRRPPPSQISTSFESKLMSPRAAGGKSSGLDPASAGAWSGGRMNMSEASPVVWSAGSIGVAVTCSGENPGIGGGMSPLSPRQGIAF